MISNGDSEDWFTLSKSAQEENLKIQKMIKKEQEKNKGLLQELQKLKSSFN